MRVLPTQVRAFSGENVIIHSLHSPRKGSNKGNFVMAKYKRLLGRKEKELIQEMSNRQRYQISKRGKLLEHGNEYRYNSVYKVHIYE